MNKKFFAAVAIAALMGVGGYFAKSSITQNDGLSDLELANAEALADDDEYSGKTCWNEGKYDIDYPDALVCDTPCKMKPWNPPYWGGRSECQ